jgi:hypothetical protein
MTVARQLGQAVLLLALLGCVARLLAVTIANKDLQRHTATVHDRPIWIRDQCCDGVLPAGDIGGDSQASESFSVCFHHRDHPGVLVTYCYDATTDPDNPTTITVQSEIEYLLCTDPADLGGSELWSAYRTTVLPGRYASLQAATDAALEAAQAHLVCEEPWSGRSPWTLEHQEEPR